MESAISLTSDCSLLVDGVELLLSENRCMSTLSTPSKVFFGRVSSLGKSCTGREATEECSEDSDDAEAR